MERQELDSIRWLGLVVSLLVAAPSFAQTTVNGNSLAYKSTGSADGSAWVLDRNGYVGTYITLAAPGTVTIKVNAAGTSAGGVNPHLSVAVADSIGAFTVGSTTADYAQQFSLPAGTHFVRTQFDNDLALTARQLRINSLTVTGAAIANAATSANALAASDTYIANYRKGNVTLNLAGLGLPAGSPIGVSLKKLDFAWGTVAHGSGTSGVNSYLGSNGTAQQTNYQSRLLQNFNALGTENAGKWNDTEATRGSPTMGGVDAVLNYAQAHNLTTRLHALAYDLDGNDPAWVNTLRSDAVTNPAALTDLRNALSSRINYYLPASRAAKVGAVDVFNESYQSECCRGASSYMNLFGPAGIASVFSELQQKLGAAKTQLFVNEYESLIYANGNAAAFMPHIEKIMQAGIDAGYGQIVDGIGTQHYPWSLEMHSPSDILKAMQTYNVTGLPQTLTELGAYTDNGLTDADAATILGDVMRLEFGNPNSNGVYLWGFHRENGGANLFVPGLALYDVNTADWSNWSITPAGKVWQDKLGIADWDGNAANGWTTQTTKNLAANGTISFDGYWGDYVITAGGKSYNLSLVKGTNSYAIGALAGDFNSDGRVDSADYVWLRNFANTPANYATWRQNFGRTAATGALAGSAVPEPTSAAILLTALFASIIHRARSSFSPRAKKDAAEGNATSWRLQINN